ncbi:cell division ATPase MinD [Candidatus Pyrohabitans sp.]
MGTSITIAAGKGGTGKTTISANLGVALGKRGQDVTILDADIAMANLELVLGMEGRSITLQDVLAGDCRIEEAVYEGPGGVKVIPAGISLSKLRRVNPERLAEVMGRLVESTEILIIDAPAGLGKEACIALSMAENLILVVTPEISSLSDALKTKKVAERCGTNILGAILNRATGDEFDLTAQHVSTVLDTKILAVVPEDAEVKKAAAIGVPLVISSPTSQAAVAVNRLAAELLGEDYIPPPTQEKRRGILQKLLGGLRLKQKSAS